MLHVGLGTSSISLLSAKLLGSQGFLHPQETPRQHKGSGLYAAGEVQGAHVAELGLKKSILRPTAGLSTALQIA